MQGKESFRDVTDDLCLTQRPIETDPNGIPTIGGWLGYKVEGRDYRQEWVALQARRKASAASTGSGDVRAFSGWFSRETGRAPDASEIAAFVKAMATKTPHEAALEALAAVQKERSNVPAYRRRGRAGAPDPPPAPPGTPDPFEEHFDSFEGATGFTQPLTDIETVSATN